MSRPLVVHIVYRLAIGGLENGLVNLINHMPDSSYRHAIVCLTNHTGFSKRITRSDVDVFDLNKSAGQDLGIYRRLWTLFRNLRPAIVHTRNLSGLEYLVPAALSGVKGRVHGEHGRDISDIDGQNIRHNVLRRLTSLMVDRYIAVSADLARWLVRNVGIPSEKITQIYNGVDAQRFRPRGNGRPAIGPVGFSSPGKLVIGTVGRMNPVKDQMTLVKAFIRLVAADRAGARQRLRLAIVGEGTLKTEAFRMLREAEIDHLAWLPGDREDIPEIMRGMDLFVLPSLAEGISNTILEAMASGRPVVATRVGGNPELVDDGTTGTLVPAADPVALADAISRYVEAPEMMTLQGRAGREKVEAYFSMEAMVDGYMKVYDEVLRGKPCAA